MTNQLGADGNRAAMVTTTALNDRRLVAATPVQTTSRLGTDWSFIARQVITLTSTDGPISAALSPSQVTDLGYRELSCGCGRRRVDPLADGLG